MTHHDGGLGAAAADLPGILAGGGGEVGEFLGVGIRPDDLDGEVGLEGVGGVQGGDRGHGEFVSSRAGFGGVGPGRREQATEVGEHRTDDGGREVGDCMHRGAHRLECQGKPDGG